MFPVVSPFRLRVSQHLDHATFPIPATSNAACGFPALRSPVCFAPRLMDESADNKTGEWIEPVHDRYTSALESGFRVI